MKGRHFRRPHDGRTAAVSRKIVDFPAHLIWNYMGHIAKHEHGPPIDKTVAAITTERRSPQRSMRESLHPAADPVDITQQAAEREMAGWNIDRESTQVRRLRSAIGRIDNGTYGIFTRRS